MANLFWLIKFGKKEHLESLMEKGQMRFSSIEGFGSSTEKERGDEFEGAINIINEQLLRIECDHPDLGKFIFKPAPNSLGTIINFTTGPYYCFSSYALTSNIFNDTDDHKIDERMSAFGDYALIIKEPILFLNQVKSRLTELNMKFTGKLIDYKDYKQEGTINTSLFSKTNDLQHQFEHRILIQTERKDEAIFIEIGSIKEFCFLSRTDEMLKTEFKANRRQIN